MKKPLIIRGVEYASQREAAAALGVEESAITRARARGKLDFVALEACDEGQRRDYGKGSLKSLTIDQKIEIISRYTEGGEFASELAQEFGLRTRKMVVSLARDNTIASLTAKKEMAEARAQAAAERKANPPKPVREQAVVVRQRVAVPVALVKRCGTSAEPKPPHPVLQTKGKWRALEAYAAANGISRTKALQLWHQARAGVV